MAGTRIAFTGGTWVSVAEDAQTVSERLADERRNGEHFSYFQGNQGEAYYVATDQVAYVEQLGEPVSPPTD